MSESKNNVAWEKIFENFLILNKLENTDYFLISSSFINEFREARLMTKFDHHSQLPKIFIEHKLSILPISRGDYAIGRFKAFHNFTKDENSNKIQKIDFPRFLESLNLEEITSESTAINCAFIANIIQDFTGESELYPTVSGRMSSSSFNFNIDVDGQKNICQLKVNKSQIEIDGGYEGNDSLIIIEAKNYISDDFLIRQLFYPYKLWTQKVNKKVRPVFLTYTNGIFHLREYVFTNEQHYNSIQLIKQQKYEIQEDITINIEIIQNILNKVSLIQEPRIPFPQANYFERTINLCELLKQKNTLAQEEITQEYGFSSRQTNYYASAGEYLGLIERVQENKTSVYKLTKRGIDLMELSIVDRKLELIELILAHEIFNKVLHLYFKQGYLPSKEKVVGMMYAANLFNINSDETYGRRSSTIFAWIKWIISLIEE